MSRGAYARGKWALGECARSGRKMLLRNMVADGYYPNLIVDPEWYDPKHPQESLPSLKDPTSLFRPAPDRDGVSAVLNLGAAVDPDAVFPSTQLVAGYEIGGVSFASLPVSQSQWVQDSTVTPEPDTGDIGGFPLTYLSVPTPSQPSMRKDATGSSISYSNGARISTGVAFLVYGNGFTVEYIVRATAIGSISVLGGISRAIPSFHAHANSQRGIFELTFDNWNNPGAGTDLTPCFVLIGHTRNYDTIDDRVAIEGEARGSTVLTIGNTYHLAGTLSAAGEAKLYVNGVREATANINMISWIGSFNEDLTSGSRTLRGSLEIGTRFISGAWRPTANAGSALIDEARFYTSALSPSDIGKLAALANTT